MTEQAKILEILKRCSCDCQALPPFTREEVGEASVVDRSNVLEEVRKQTGRGALETLQEGMNVELEHCDITHGDLYLTARIALAHLKEDPDYYVKLKKAGL